MKKQIFILHGIARTSYHMRKIASYFESEGFLVHNIDYPSTKYNMESLAEMIAHQIRIHNNPDYEANFIGYSLGGLLLRVIFNIYSLPELEITKMGRIVQLAPPNNGSEVVDFLCEHPILRFIFKSIFGAAGLQLTTSQEGISYLLGEIEYPIGVIAGSRSYDPISTYIINGGSEQIIPSLMGKGHDDGKVTIQSTKIAEMSDHIVVPECHTFFPHNKFVQFQAKNFIENGYFSKSR